MDSDIGFYEQLREHLGEEVARLIAERWRLGADVATKTDVNELKLITTAELKAMETRILRWMLTFFVPLWLGVFGIIITLLVQG